MRTNGLLPVVAAVLIAFSPAALSPTAWAAGDAEKGRQLAVDHCSRCHVIPDYNRLGGIDSTPSFGLLARFDDYLERFQTFFQRRPHPVFVRAPGVAPPTSDPAFIATFQVDPQQIDDLIAYVETLRAQQ